MARQIGLWAMGSRRPVPRSGRAVSRDLKKDEGGGDADETDRDPMDEDRG